MQTHKRQSQAETASTQTRIKKGITHYAFNCLDLFNQSIYSLIIILFEYTNKQEISWTSVCCSNRPMQPNLLSALPTFALFVLYHEIQNFPRHAVFAKLGIHNTFHFKQ